MLCWVWHWTAVVWWVSNQWCDGCQSSDVMGVRAVTWWVSETWILVWQDDWGVLTGVSEYGVHQNLLFGDDQEFGWRPLLRYWLYWSRHLSPWLLFGTSFSSQLLWFKHALPTDCVIWVSQCLSFWRLCFCHLWNWVRGHWVIVVEVIGELTSPCPLPPTRVCAHTPFTFQT